MFALGFPVSLFSPADIRWLLIFDYGCLLSIARVTWRKWGRNATVMYKVIGKDNKIIDEFLNFHQLRWLEHVLCKPENRPSRWTMLFGVRVGWKEASDHQKKTWHHTVNSSSFELSRVERFRSPVWSLHDNCYQ